MRRNPKQEGSNIWDCVPQTGPCPMGCNQCYYNLRWYTDMSEPIIPTLEEVGDGLVRVNSGHDSNIRKAYVLEVTEKYPRKFYNTSIPNFDFPAPVVFTANRVEEIKAPVPMVSHLDNLMFVRLRVSPTNLSHIYEVAARWSSLGIPVVLTFMRYYTVEVPFIGYTVKKHVVNTSRGPTRDFMTWVWRYCKDQLETKGEILMCGTLDSPLCKHCGNCERLYKEHMEARG